MTQDEYVASLENQIATWKSIQATNQQTIRTLTDAHTHDQELISMLRNFHDLTKSVILPVDEFRRMQTQLTEETKYSERMVAMCKQLQKELDQQIEEKFALMDEITKMRSDECCLSSDEEDEIDQIVKEINDER